MSDARSAGGTSAIRDVIDGIAKHIVSTTDCGRTDRLWPAHHAVFSTNPLSIAYGACGILEFLWQALGEVPDEVRAWLQQQRVTPRDYPPGLLVGSAGIAYQYWRLGLASLAEEAMEACYESPLRFADPTMFYGAAGWGLVSLYLHRSSGDTRHLIRASEACNYILASGEHEEDLLYWIHAADRETHFGYGCGASGIALFLLRCSEELGREDALVAADTALAFDLAHRIEDRHGWAWPHYRGGRVRLPYWGHGAVGVGTTAVRFAAALGREDCASVAETIADSTDMPWTILPGKLDGLSGIGEYMLDMYLVTGRDLYLQRAARIGETLLWYAIERPGGGIGFPGRWQTRFSTDFATGAAGVGLFLLRLLNPGPRYMVDLNAADFLRSEIGEPKRQERRQSEMESDASQGKERRAEGVSAAASAWQFEAREEVYSR